jgi:hypothetical protein
MDTLYCIFPLKGQGGRDEGGGRREGETEREGWLLKVPISCAQKMKLLIYYYDLMNIYSHCLLFYYLLPYSWVTVLNGCQVMKQWTINKVMEAKAPDENREDDHQTRRFYYIRWYMPCQTIHYIQQ